MPEEELNINQVTENEPTQSDGTTGKPEITQEPDYYTPQEIESIDPDNLDLNRVAPEQKSAFKIIDAVNKKRTQEIANLKREYEDRLKQSQSSQPSDPLYQSYRQDPFAFKQTVNSEIRKLRNMAESVDPMAEGAIPYKQKIYNQIDMLEDKVIGYEKQHYQENQAKRGMEQISNVENKVYSDLYKAIPNYEKRAPELRKFAVETLGMTNDEIDIMTSPGLIYFDYNTNTTQFLGDKVVNLVKGINKAFEIINAGKVLKQKENRAPNYVENPGMGNASTKDNQDRLKGLENKAIKSGKSDDWTAYIQAQIEERERS